MFSTTPAPAGRPRAFDIDEALDRVVLVFWSKGFEAPALTTSPKRWASAAPACIGRSATKKTSSTKR